MSLLTPLLTAPSAPDLEAALGAASRPNAPGVSVTPTLLATANNSRPVSIAVPSSRHANNNNNDNNTTLTDDEEMQALGTSLWDRMSVGKSFRTGMMMNPRGIAGAENSRSNRDLSAATSGPSTAPVTANSSSRGDASENEHVVGALSRSASRRAALGSLAAPLLLAPLLLSPPGSLQQQQQQSRRLLWHGGSFGHYPTASLVAGCIMAMIYAASRIPQIVENAQRGAVRGLFSFELFVFAAVGNATYLASILFRGFNGANQNADDHDAYWRGQAPWLLDVVLCLTLDIVLLVQWIAITWRSKLSTMQGQDILRRVNLR